MAVLERGVVSAEDARNYAGQWVAISDNRVLFGSPEAEIVLAWVEKNHRDVHLVTKLPREGAPRRWAL